MSPDQVAVLDFDGVIVDSMPLHAEAYRRILAPYGIRPSDEDIYQQEGARSETIIRDALERAGVDFDDADVTRLGHQKQETFGSLGPPKPYPGAVDFVRRLAADGDRLGLVTGTRRQNVDRLVPKLVDLFDAILAQADYTHDKPHPEPYALAFERLDIDPAHAAVVENAERGVRSARAAGAGWVVAITTTRPAAALRDAGAHDVVADHAEAARSLEEWFARHADRTAPS